MILNNLFIFLKSPLSCSFLKTFFCYRCISFFFYFSNTFDLISIYELMIFHSDFNFFRFFFYISCSYYSVKFKVVKVVCLNILSLPSFNNTLIFFNLILLFCNHFFLQPEVNLVFGFFFLFPSCNGFSMISNYLNSLLLYVFVCVTRS